MRSIATFNMRNVAVRNRMARLGLRSYCDMHDAIFEAGAEWTEPNPLLLKNIACQPQIPYGDFQSDGHPDWVQLPSGLWVMDFAGTGIANDQVIVPYHTGLDCATGITMECWVCPNTVGPDERTGAIFKSACYWIEIYDASINPRFYIDGTWRDGATKGGVFAVGVWRRIFVSYDSVTHIARSYVNVSGASKEYEGLSDYLINTNSNPLRIGDQGGVRENWFDGKIALPRIFSYSRTADQREKSLAAERAWFGV